ncbi:MAG: tRNA (adenosine(37)-N6)-dimethylallyltransferase MiaA [Chloroflexi bacterium]|nr:MAG: tRNA (adenosine(37)-N6)-dimethylallyltransferase MiaA [Phototrophicales bacterium]RMF80092.1 MAG: tRNA (adenosine(37)-N6)-dimethylallyltransferase MiaA [Chloroflexota bacterium]
MHLAGKPPLVVLIGPTAIGKTDIAIEIAREIDGEILGADSRQVYRYMDIGTAKPTPQQRERATHHLIDFIDPDENLSLAQYQEMAYAIIDDIHKRGKMPLLVGGTGQYVTAVIEGWSIPEVAPNELLRTELEAFAKQHGAQALHQRLAQQDPLAAERIHPNNIRRVVRALEVCIESGQPMSELQRKHPPPYQIHYHGLTLERELLYQRADRRVDAMIEAGFVDEVKNLLQRGYSPTLPSMSGLGYRQIVSYLQNEITLGEAIMLTKHATHDFIRRQETWFRKHDTGIIWHNQATRETDTLLDDIITSVIG